MSDDPRYENDSKALIARYGDDVSFIVGTGDSLQSALDDVGHHPDDLGFFDAPQGFSIWEGVFSSYVPGFDEEKEEPILRGHFRSLNDEEWQAVHRGDVPW